MFFTKKPQKPIQVKCETCKHWVDKADCQEVKISSYYGMYWMVFSGKSPFHHERKYYCPIHKKPYDSIQCGKFFKTIPAHEVEVDEEGKEIKKK